MSRGERLNRERKEAPLLSDQDSRPTRASTRQRAVKHEFNAVVCCNLAMSGLSVATEAHAGPVVVAQASPTPSHSGADPIRDIEERTLRRWVCLLLPVRSTPGPARCTPFGGPFLVSNNTPSHPHSFARDATLRCAPETHQHPLDTLGEPPV